MAKYGTKEYWEDIRDRSAIVLDSLKRTSITPDITYKKANDFCKVFMDNYDEYVNAIEQIHGLEVANVGNSDA